MATNSDTPPPAPERGPQTPAQPAGSPPLRPGDEAAPGTPGTAETICRQCGGSGRDERDRPCPLCLGTGRLNVGIGGA